MEPQNPREFSISRTPDLHKEEEDVKDEKHQTAADLKDNEAVDSKIHVEEAVQEEEHQTSSDLKDKEAVDSKIHSGKAVEDEEECSRASEILEGKATADSEIDGKAAANLEIDGEAAANSEIDGEAAADSEIDGEAAADSEIDGEAAADSEIDGEAAADSEVNGGDVVEDDESEEDDDYVIPDYFTVENKIVEFSAYQVITLELIDEDPTTSTMPPDQHSENYLQELRSFNARNRFMLRDENSGTYYNMKVLLNELNWSLGTYRFYLGGEWDKFVQDNDLKDGDHVQFKKIDDEIVGKKIYIGL